MHTQGVAVADFKIGQHFRLVSLQNMQKFIILSLMIRLTKNLIFVPINNFNPTDFTQGNLGSCKRQPVEIFTEFIMLYGHEPNTKCQKIKSHGWPCTITRIKLVAHSNLLVAKSSLDLCKRRNPTLRVVQDMDISGLLFLGLPEVGQCQDEPVC